MHQLNPPKTESSGLSASSETVRRLTEAKHRAQVLIGCYRTGDANDPETYVAAIISVLAGYPVEVIREVTEPATGLPSKVSWLPTVAEVKKACDELWGPWRYAQEWEAGARRQIADRQTLAIADHRPRKSYEQIKAEFAAIGIYFDKKSKPIDVGAVRQKFGISQEQWDAIPDAPK